MSAVIYHNQHCSKSRKTLEILRDAGKEPEIIAYLETPPDIREIETLLAALKLDDPRALMRTKEDIYQQLGLGKPGVSRAELIAAIAAHPVLLERPIVVTDKGARLCRPPELVRDIL